MLLLDVGNSRIKIWEEGRVRTLPATPDVSLPDTPFYYICVNAALLKRLAQMPHAIDLASCFALKRRYEGLGIDRIAACYAIESGVVVDAGSAITVDVMEAGVHQGGFILPGIRSFEQSFATISPTLAQKLDLRDVDLTQLPQKTSGALHYGTLKAIVLPILEVAKGRRLYLCGGDAEVLAEYLPRCEVRADLVFEGMQKVIKERGC